MKGLNSVSRSADSPGMPRRSTPLLLRLVVLTLVWVFATTSITLASDDGTATEPTPTAPPATGDEVETATVLVVPDVRRQTYVFAKGFLEDAGFGWHVNGAVKGYASNRVVWQNPAPGTLVENTGAPVILVRLEKQKGYPERGIPENDAPYGSTELVLVKGEAGGGASAPPAAEDDQAPTPPASPTPPAAPQPASPAPASATPAGDDPAKPAAAKVSKAKKSAKVQAALAKPAAKPARRTPDFVVAGAPAEPADEMPLPQRARNLAAKMAAAQGPSQSLMRYFVYQHNWVVYGARFGWQDGEAALRILVELDQTLERRWNVAHESEQSARAALAFVASRKAR